MFACIYCTVYLRSIVRQSKIAERRKLCSLLHLSCFFWKKGPYFSPSCSFSGGGWWLKIAKLASPQGPAEGGVFRVGSGGGGGGGGGRDGRMGRGITNAANDIWICLGRGGGWEGLGSGGGWKNRAFKPDLSKGEKSTPDLLYYYYCSIPNQYSNHVSGDGYYILTLPRETKTTVDRNFNDFFSCIPCFDRRGKKPKKVLDGRWCRWI